MHGNYNVIDRFSEDIDIILDWGLLGIKGDEPLAERSNTQQDKYNKALNKKAAAFIKSKLLPDVKNGLCDILGFEADIRVDEKEVQALNFYYPKMYQVGALLQFIRLKIGPLAAWTPSQTVEITPYVAEEMPNIFEPKARKCLQYQPKEPFGKRQRFYIEKPTDQLKNQCL